MRSFARAFSSSRRAPPMQASKSNSAIASSSVTDWCTLRLSSGVLQHDAPAGDRVLDRAHDQPFAELGCALVAERDHFRKVVAGVDVQQRKREASRAKRLFGQAQQHQRILAAGEEQGGIAALARDLAQDVDRLGFEPGEVMRIGRRERFRRRALDDLGFVGQALRKS